MKHIIQCRHSRDRFEYDDELLTITDKIGNTIKLFEPLEGLSDVTKRIYIERLFKNIYVQVNEFKDICQEYKEKGLGDVDEYWGGKL